MLGCGLVPLLAALPVLPVAAAEDDGSAAPPIPRHDPRPVAGGAGATALAQAQSRLALILVRNVFAALGQAISTGNYSVLRDLSAPGFRRDFPESRLVAVFAPIRDAGVDFSPAVLMLPHLNHAELLESGLLRLSGVLPTQPLTARFDFVFQWVAGGWQLLGIAVDPVPPPGQPAHKRAASPPDSN
jgi:hypothetical protein